MKPSGNPALTSHQAKRRFDLLGLGHRSLFSALLIHDKANQAEERG
jgi:hypothetical protein